MTRKLPIKLVYLKKFTTDSKYSIIILLNHYLDLINLTKLSFKSRYIILIYKNIYYIIYIIWLWKNHHLTIANHHLNVQNFWFSQLRLHEPRTYPYRGNRDNCFNIYVAVLAFLWMVRVARGVTLLARRTW